MPDAAARPGPDRWRRLEEIFLAAVDLPPIERAEFLRQSCGEDAALRAEAESLLAHAAEDSPTIPSLVAAMAASLVDDPASSPSPQPAAPPPAETIPGEGRFVPGTLLAGRYRIVALLGRGGMGEVYRATDLTLGQPVALKLLPPEASRNQRLLERFHGEVRVARQVSHPNICRVYDIGEAAGMPFLSMEYVDGEDLASLLLRIGRLPADRALTTARKLCAGLAAAHERGIMHRDLKPANVMINKRGDVVIMDFGLAAIDSRFLGPEARNGTPAYMAPEQLRGAHVSARSDIYALGLVLYELFTGKRPYDASTITRLLELQEAAQFARMSSIALDIDPAVERAVRKCLDPDPANRPATALEVAAMLPGRDPLAEALAAGITPSPEAVAAAGKTEGLALKFSIPCLLLVAAGLSANMYLCERSDVLLRTPAFAPQVLAQKSRDIAAALGYQKPPEDSSSTLQSDAGLLHFIAPLSSARAAAWLAAENPWQLSYRESPSLLISDPVGALTADNPPFVQPGMTRVLVDGSGRLRRFEAVPFPPLADLPPEAFDKTFAAMGLDLSRFHEVPPVALPAAPVFAMRAWKGPHPRSPETELRVEIGAANGQITSARLLFPWDDPGIPAAGDSPVSHTLRTIISCCFVVGVLLAAFWAARNWRLGRVDRKGALRVAIAFFAIDYFYQSGRIHVVPDYATIYILFRLMADELLWAATLWVAYAALEPALRARWPHSIVTWNRLLAGKWKDAQIGAHILIGAAAGTLISVIMQLIILDVGRRRWGDKWLFMTGAFSWMTVHAGVLSAALLGGISVMFTMLGLRQLFRSAWLGAVFTAAIWSLVTLSNMSPIPWHFAVAFGSLDLAVMMLILTRFGLLSAVAMAFYTNDYVYLIRGSHWSAWYTPFGLATFILLLSIALFAFWRSLGGRRLLSAPA